MKKVNIAVLYYLVAFFLVLTAGQFSAANKPGSRLDVVIYAIILIMSIVLLVKSIGRVRSGGRVTRWVLAINLAGILGLGAIIAWRIMIA